MPIAQLRHEGKGGWALFFGDRNGKWVMYFDLDPKQPVDLLINELEEDPTWLAHTGSLGARCKSCWSPAQRRGEAFEPRSRRPHLSPQQTPADLEDEVVEFRKAVASDGFDAGAGTIAYHLAERHGTSPSASTIWRILQRWGFVGDEPHKRPRSSFIRFMADLPTSGGRPTSPMSTSPAGRRSRWVLNHWTTIPGCWWAPMPGSTFKAADVVTWFKEGRRPPMGTPASYLTDNAAVFTVPIGASAGRRSSVS